MCVPRVRHSGNETDVTSHVRVSHIQPLNKSWLPRNTLGLLVGCKSAHTAVHLIHTSDHHLMLRHNSRHSPPSLAFTPHLIVSCFRQPSHYGDCWCSAFLQDRIRSVDSHGIFCITW